MSLLSYSLSLSLSQLVKGERVRAILSYNQDYELKLFTNSSKVCVINDTQYFNTLLSWYMFITMMNMSTVHLRAYALNLGSEN